MGLIGRFIFGFTLLTEVTPSKHQAIAGTLFQALDAVAPLYITLFISQISNKTIVLVWVGLALNVLCCIGAYFLVESPAWYNTMGDKQKAIETIQYIARFNGAVPFEIVSLKDEKFEIEDPTKVNQD